MRIPLPTRRSTVRFARVLAPLGAGLRVDLADRAFALGDALARLRILLHALGAELG